jgi:hypothetical protein
VVIAGLSRFVRREIAFDDGPRHAVPHGPADQNKRPAAAVGEEQNISAALAEPAP